MSPLTLKNKYYRTKFLFDIIVKDLRSPFPLDMRRKIAMWKNGFLAEKFILYELGRNNKNEYISDYKSSLSRFINGGFCEILNNKFIFEKIVSHYINIPKTYFLLFNGRFYSVSQNSKLVTFEDFLSLLLEVKRLVVKPLSGGGGRGVQLLYIDGEGVRLNGAFKSHEDLKILVEGLDQCLVSEFIEQSEFSKSLYPGSINTIRALTMLDPDNGEAFMPVAVQRIGNSRSAPQDNFSKGGLSTRINIETGELGAALTHPHGQELLWHESHPDTKSDIRGVIIPEWNNVRETILRAAQSLPYLKLVGWDILIGKKGVYAIEGNNHPDPDVIQGHFPLLTDSRVKRFYKFHKIIR